MLKSFFKIISSWSLSINSIYSGVSLLKNLHNLYLNTVEYHLDVKWWLYALVIYKKLFYGRAKQLHIGFQFLFSFMKVRDLWFQHLQTTQLIQSIQWLYHGCKKRITIYIFTYQIASSSGPIVQLINEGSN